MRLRSGSIWKGKGRLGRGDKGEKLKAENGTGYEKCPTCGFATIYTQKRKVKHAIDIEKTTQSGGNRRASPRGALQAQQEFTWDEQGAVTRLRQH
jgi:hypothetical protein